MIKGSIQEEDITLISIYAPNVGAPRYIQQILTDIKVEMESSHCGSVKSNPTSIHEVLCSIPGLAQWVRDLGVVGTVV